MLSNPRPLRVVSTTRTLQVYKLLGIRYASHVIEASEKRPTPDGSYTFLEQFSLAQVELKMTQLPCLGV